MKIAMMTNNYKPFVSGVAISVERLTESLRKCGHQVVVFAPEYAGQKEEVDVVRYKSLLKGVAGGFSIPNSLDSEIEKQFKREKFDLIHVHHPMMIGHTAQYLSKKYNLPLVFTYHTRYEQYLHYVGLSSLKKAIPAYITKYMKKCDMVFAPTPLMKEYLEQIQENQTEKTAVRVLPTGLPEDSFIPNKVKTDKLRKQLLGNNQYLFCTVARLAKEKNLDFLLRSMKHFQEIYNSKFKLILIGEGPERKTLEKLTEQLGLVENVKFLGTVFNAEIKNYCAASDLFLFPSLTETQGIVLLEAMAVGTPVIALRATGTEDIVINGKNGYMTEVSEIEFAEKIQEVLDNKEMNLLRVGAGETAENYRCERIAEEAIKNYKEVLLNFREDTKRI